MIDLRKTTAGDLEVLTDREFMSLSAFLVNEARRREEALVESNYELLSNDRPLPYLDSLIDKVYLEFEQKRAQDERDMLVTKGSNAELLLDAYTEIEKLSAVVGRIAPDADVQINLNNELMTIVQTLRNHREAFYKREQAK